MMKEWWKKMKKKDYIYISIFIITPLLIIFLCKDNNQIFGNLVDWLNQHVMIGDALRHAIIQQKTPLPTYLPAYNAGMNIFHFSYYGYLRLDILIGAILCHVEMIDILIIYHICLMSLTGICCYVFLKQHIDKQDICFFVSLLVMLSSLFFHSHKQIMFVNYLPFLFLALICLHDDFKGKHLFGFVLCGLLIVIHSYFYSFACFMICLIYYMYGLYNKKQLNFKHMIPFFIGTLEIVLMSAVLTIPTLYVIINNSKSVQFDIHSLYQLSFSLKGLLYDGYGCGFTYLAWIALVLGLTCLKTRFFSFMTMIAMILPLVSYFLNGFLYARSKILIVFIPFVAYIIAHVLENIFNKEIMLSWWQIPLFCLPLFFMKKPFLGLLDFMVCIVLYLLFFHFSKSYFLYLLIPLCVVYQNNVFIQKNVVNECFNQNTLTLLKRNQDSIVRLGQLNMTHQNVNNTYQMNVSRASGYTSTNHTLYNSFLYDTLRIPISINNRVANEDSQHIFYLQMMSVNSLMSPYIPAGYCLKDQYKNEKLYQSPYTMPIAYASSDLYSEKQLQQLAFPYNLDILYNHVIVKNGKNQAQSQFVKENVPVSSYRVKNNKKKTITYDLKRINDHEIFIIEFDIDNLIPTQNISITINGMKNQLSSINHPYYNANTHFTYVLSHEKAIDKLKVTLSKGSYNISDIHMYSLDFDVIKNRCQQVDKLQIQKGDDILNGTINVLKKGYFVTNIPYEKGYSIFIDQKEVTPEIVNTAFLGCPIDSGKHHIKITYQPPGYLLSLKVSAFGLCLTILHIIYERKTYS